MGRPAKGYRSVMGHGNEPTGVELWRLARAQAAHAAIATWGVIASYYNGSFYIEEKADGPCTEADRAADLAILERLRRTFPPDRYGYLSEETVDDRDRLNHDRVWIIDPIDGTRDFINGTGNFAIHIALVERMADLQWHPVAAVVYLPVLGRLYSAVRGEGAHRQHVPAPPKPGDWDNPRQPLRVSNRAEPQNMRSVVSNANRTSRLMRLIHSLQLEDHWHVGSLGVKLSAIADGEAELYVNLSQGKAKEWDTCAPHLILSEAGGMMTDLAGAPITYNQPDVHHNAGLLASNGPAHHMLIDHVRRFLDQEARSGG